MHRTSRNCRWHRIREGTVSSFAFAYRGAKVLKKQQKTVAKAVFMLHWTDFGGLKREYVEISLLDGKLDKPFLFDQKVIHRYDCGIMF